MRQTFNEQAGRVIRASRPAEDIIFFHADFKYVTAVYAGGSMVLPDTLKALEVECGDEFVRTHRSYLVRKSVLEKLRGNKNDGFWLTINGWPDPLPVSRRCHPGVRAAMTAQ